MKSSFKTKYFLICWSVFIFGSCVSPLEKERVEVIGNSIKLGHLEIAENRFPNQMTWSEANKACENLGKGWRLPTDKEITYIRMRSMEIGRNCFYGGCYWSSIEVGLQRALASYGEEKWPTLKTQYCYVLAVKTTKGLSDKQTIDKNVKPEVRIGNQIWMTKNLNVDHFRNGDVIPEAKTEDEWLRLSEYECKPAWCYYQNDKKYGDKLGKLYNWYAVNDPRGLAPEGWHIPSEDEWKTLKNYLGGSFKAAKKMMTKEGWEPQYGRVWVMKGMRHGYQEKRRIGIGTNESGFSALPGGFRARSGAFAKMGAYWWSSTKGYGRYEAFAHELKDYTGIKRIIENKSRGLSVRCVK